MAKAIKPEPHEPTQPHRVKAFLKTYLPPASWPFYATVLFCGMLFAMLVTPSYNLTKTVIFLLLLAQSLLLARYRFFDWKPEKSKAFAIGAMMVVNVVHTEGILRYKRDGMEYALFSNKVGAPKDDQPKKA